MFLSAKKPMPVKPYTSDTVPEDFNYHDSIKNVLTAMYMHAPLIFLDTYRPTATSLSTVKPLITDTPRYRHTPYSRKLSLWK